MGSHRVPSAAAELALARLPPLWHASVRLSPSAREQLRCRRGRGEEFPRRRFPVAAACCPCQITSEDTSFRPDRHVTDYAACHPLLLYGSVTVWRANKEFTQTGEKRRASAARPRRQQQADKWEDGVTPPIAAPPPQGSHDRCRRALTSHRPGSDDLPKGAGLQHSQLAVVGQASVTAPRNWSCGPKNSTCQGTPLSVTTIIPWKLA